MSDFHAPVRLIGTLESFPRPAAVGEETRADASYHFTGADRPDGAHCIFQYSLSGWGVFSDAAGRHRLPPGTGFLCESNDPATAYGYAPENGEPWHFIYIGFVGAAAHAMVRDLVRRCGGVYELPLEHPVVKRLRAFQVHADVGVTLSASEAARLLFDLLHALALSREAGQAERPDHRLVCRAQEYIDDYLENNINVGDIARILKVSREHLGRVFKQQTGQAPYQYILERKLLLACRLLKDTTLSVKEVGQRLGFESPAHFVRTFRRGLRQTPGQFSRHGIMPVVLPSHTAGPGKVTVPPSLPGCARRVSGCRRPGTDT